jgi:hypothetical protein
MTTDTLTEEQKLALVPGIQYTGTGATRRACLAGIRVSVAQVVESWRECDCSLTRCQQECWWWVAPELIEAAIRFYELFPGEVDALIEQIQSERERAEREGRVIHLEASDRSRIT